MLSGLAVVLNISPLHSDTYFDPTAVNITERYEAIGKCSPSSNGKTNDISSITDNKSQICL